MATPIPRQIVPSVEPAPLKPRQAEREFRALLEAGARMRVAGDAKQDPESLLADGYTPKHKLELDPFATTLYLTNPRQNPDIRFFVAYVVQARAANGKLDVFPRIFYKDISLIWRSASHYVRTHGENWIGKGEARVYDHDGDEVVESAEETTDLPLEIQTALETLNHSLKRVPEDDIAIELVLRGGHSDRIEPYRDFSEPRERARANPRNLVNGGRSIARFARKNDPESLRFTPGYEPDFSQGVLETGHSRSSMYGGELQRFRILSKNRQIQYLFFAGPHHVWIIPPQATTTELSSYATRTIDVIADEDLCIPGFEYHFLDEDEAPPVHVSQIPKGFAGPPSQHDNSRADASAWLDRLPVIQDFRKKVLGERS